MPDKNLNKADSEAEEIDLLQIAFLLWSKKKFILKFGLVLLIFGVVIAFSSKVEYKTYTKLLPESSSAGSESLGGLSGLSGLAGLAGINLGGGGSSGALSPTLYPELMSSLPFLIKLYNEEVFFAKEDRKMSSKEYFEEVDSPGLSGYLYQYTVGLPWMIKGMFTKQSPAIVVKGDTTASEILNLTKREFDYVQTFGSRFSISVDELTGMISITSEMPDPVAAAQILKIAKSMLTEDIIAYKVKKAKENVQFVEKSYLESKTRYNHWQAKLARFKDTHRNVSTSYAGVELERIKNEYSLSYELYKGLALQLEQAKIKLKEDTPVFTVFEPVRIPEDKSKPKKGLMILGFTFFGVFLATIIVLVKGIFSALLIQRK